MSRPWCRALDRCRNTIREAISRGTPSGPRGLHAFRRNCTCSAAGTFSGHHQHSRRHRRPDTDTDTDTDSMSQKTRRPEFRVYLSLTRQTDTATRSVVDRVSPTTSGSANATRTNGRARRRAARRRRDSVNHVAPWSVLWETFSGCLPFCCRVSLSLLLRSSLFLVECRCAPLCGVCRSGPRLESATQFSIMVHRSPGAHPLPGPERSRSTLRHGSARSNQGPVPLVLPSLSSTATPSTGMQGAHA